MNARDLRRAGDRWGTEELLALYEAGGIMWGQLPAVQRRINEKISGDPDIDWISHLKATHLRDRTPTERCLSLCCGRGRIDRELARRGVFARCTAYDVSDGALRAARERASAEGIDSIDYVVEDVNRMQLPQGHYGLIVGHYALHHIADLEHVLDQVNRGLTDEGLFAALDYVGPSRMARSERQLELATRALRLLPVRFRQNISWQRLGRLGPGGARSRKAWVALLWRKIRNGTIFSALGRRVHHRWLRLAGRPHIKHSVPRIRGSEMAVDDPTEAVRSAEIVPLVRKYLDVVEFKPYGGTLLMPILDDIAGNFESDDPAAEELLAMLFTIEDALMAAGEIDSDFAFIVAGKRP